jgi:two-component system OmpR family response regulator
METASPAAHPLHALPALPRHTVRTAMKILLIEDDPHTSAYVVKALREHAHVVDHSASGREGLVLASSSDYDVMIIDRMLPGLDGLAIVKTIRSAGIKAPVVLLTALGGVDDRVEGLESGADDYLAKPFAFAELLARVQALVRRASRTPEPTTLTVGDLTLDLLSRRVTRGETPLDLRPREFALLEYLMRNAGKVVSKTMILSHVWDYNFDPQTNIVDVLVSRLRDKIDRPFGNKLLHTVRGVGYVLRG